MFDIYLIKGDEVHDITGRTSGLQLDQSMDAVADVIGLDFVMDGDDNSKTPDVGDHVILMSHEKSIVFQGILIEKSLGDSTVAKYRGIDYRFYLSKSKATYQFNGIKISSAIKRILDDFNVPYGTIETMDFNLDMIFKGKNVYEIIQELFKSAELHGLGEFEVTLADGKVQVKKKVPEAPYVIISPMIQAPSRKISMENMKTALQLVDSQTKEKSFYEGQNQGMVKKYGLIQEVEAIEQKAEKNARAVGEDKLARLSKLSESYSLNLIGDFSLKPGRTIDVKDTKTGADGEFKVKSIKHDIERTGHKMSLELEVM